MTTERVEVRAITDTEIQGMVMKKLAEIIRLEDDRKEKSKKRQLAQEEETDAKNAYEAAVEELKDLQREMTGGLFDGEPERLLPTVFADADNEAIRALRIEDADLPVGLRAKLIESCEDTGKPRCATWGDMEEWVMNGGKMTKLKTVTDRKMIQIREAIRVQCQPFTGKPEEVSA